MRTLGMERIILLCPRSWILPDAVQNPAGFGRTRVNLDFRPIIQDSGAISGGDGDLAPDLDLPDPDPIELPVFPDANGVAYNQNFDPWYYGYPNPRAADGVTWNYFDPETIPMHLIGQVVGLTRFLVRSDGAVNYYSDDVWLFTRFPTGSSFNRLTQSSY